MGLDLMYFGRKAGLSNTRVLWAGGWGVRIGRPTFRLFSERHQGTRGIPVRYHYLFGARVAIIKRRARDPSIQK